jgi:transketolase-like protein
VSGLPLRVADIRDQGSGISDQKSGNELGWKLVCVDAEGEILRASSSDRRGPHMNVNELKSAAAEMRAMNVLSIYAAGSGHPGGTLSVMDLAAAFYLNELNHDPRVRHGQSATAFFGRWGTRRLRCTRRWEGLATSRWIR